MDLFPSLDEGSETPTLLGPLERVTSMTGPALPKGPKSVGVFPSPEDLNGSSFRNVVFSS
jgi:hypothetical protein